MNTLTISLAQMNFQLGQPDENFERAADWIATAAENGSNLILLPELWASGYDLEHWQRYATPMDEGLFARLAVLARDYKIAIGGSLLESRAGQAYNTFVLFRDDGSHLGVYRKIHRFRLLEEEKWLGAGDQLALIPTPWGSTGLSICYDLRFPEMFRHYGVSGVRLILLVAEWPQTRIEHWRILLQARAIENQTFVAAVNKVGESKGAKLGGRSAVIDPWGKRVVEGDAAEKLLTAEIDFREVEKARRFLPVFDDRRPDVYASDGEDYAGD